MIIHGANNKALYGGGITYPPAEVDVDNATAVPLSATPTNGSRIFIKPRYEEVAYSIYIGDENVNTSSPRLEIRSTEGVVELPFGDASEIYVLGDGSHTVTYWVI